MYQDHVYALPIEDLRNALKHAGLQNGPITVTTESVYRAALIKYLVDLEDESDQNSTFDNSSSNVDFFDSGSEGEENSVENGNVTAHQVLVDTPRGLVTPTPIRWNPSLNIYESVYGGHADLMSNTNNKRDEPHSKGIQKYMLLAVAVLFIAVITGCLLWSGNRDPYKGLEDTASQMADQG